jgi:CDP-glucose 4,6-dehydratase
LLAECLSGQRGLAGEAFNFSNEIQVTVLNLVEKILRIVGSGLTPIVLRTASHEIRHQYLNAEKARALLNWTPIYSLDEALAETVEWYREYLADV